MTPAKSPQYFVGLLSGTSVDGIDAALVQFEDHQAHLVCSHLEPFDPELRKQIMALFTPSDHQIDAMGELDVILGHKFSDAAEALLTKAGVTSDQVLAIGSHGQTIRHRPLLKHPFTLQIGDANIIAERTGINVVADFRRRDIANGGQGAPLAPAFHLHFLHCTKEDRVVVNLGGIANITYLPKDYKSLLAFDTGPANGLMDEWIQSHKKLPFDHNGQWAESGQANQALIQGWLEDPYFALPPPKSTGKEHFHLSWLTQQPLVAKLSAEDVQASLLRLSALTISAAVETYCSRESTIILCGGGSKNQALVNTLTDALSPQKVAISSEYGIDPDWMEAMAFAWLAKRHLDQEATDLQPFTGSRKPAQLGVFYPA